jgi:hypothetical protein
MGGPDCDVPKYMPRSLPWLGRLLVLLAAILLVGDALFSIGTVRGVDYSGLAIVRRPAWLRILELTGGVLALAAWLRLGGAHRRA